MRSKIFDVIFFTAIFFLSSCSQLAVNQIVKNSSGNSSSESTLSFAFPSSISLSNTTPSISYGTQSTPVFTLNPPSSVSFMAGDVISLYRDGTNSCDGSLVDTQTLSSASTTVSLSDSLTTNYGDHDYFAKVTRGSSVLCSSIAATYHLLRSLSVTYRYNYGQNWNDWTKSDDSASCAGIETNISDCIHGGDKRMVWTSYSSCSGLSMSDNLGAFDWTCEVSGGFASFVSSLKSSKRLYDLVNGSSAWSNNYVTLTGGLSDQTSSSGTWWNNTVSTLPVNASNSTPVSLNSQGTVYVLSNSASSSGLYISADKVSIAMPSSATLTNNQRATFLSSNATPDTSSGAVSAALAASSVKHLWIEGSFAGQSNREIGFLLYDVNFSNFKNLGITGFLASVGANAISDDFPDNGSDCDVVSGSNGEAGFDGIGIYLKTSNKNYFSSVAISNIRGGSGGAAVGGIQAYCSFSTSYFDLSDYFAGNGGLAYGLKLDSSSKNSFDQITVSGLVSGVGGNEVFQTNFTLDSFTCRDQIISAGSVGNVFGIYTYLSNSNSFSNLNINNINGQSPSAYNSTSVSGGNVTGINLSNSSSSTFDTITISSLTGGTGTTGNGSVNSPCGFSVQNVSPGTGGSVSGIVGNASSSLSFSNVTIDLLTGGHAGGVSVYSIPGGDTSAAIGGVSSPVYLNASPNANFNQISISNITNGDSRSGYSSAGDSSDYNGSNGSNAIGIYNNSSGTLTISNLTISYLTASSYIPGLNFPNFSGGSCYGIQSLSGVLTVNTASFNNLAAGDSYFNQGGDVYGIYDSFGGKVTSNITGGNLIPGNGSSFGNASLEN